jgi:hypothetical protein
MRATIIFAAFLFSSINAFAFFSETTPTLGISNQVLIEWQGYSDSNFQVGGDNKTKLALLKDKYFHVPSSGDLKLFNSDRLENFVDKLDVALDQLSGKPSALLRVIVNSHGLPNEFLINDGQNRVTYDAFLSAIANKLRLKGSRISRIEFYMSPCHSGSMVPALNRYFSNIQFPNMQIKAWLGSSPDRGTLDTDLSDALLSSVSTEAQLDKSTLFSSSVGPVDAFGSLGGDSKSLFWVNTSVPYRMLSVEELSKIILFGDSFLQERALTNLIESNNTSDELFTKVMSILEDESNSSHLRQLCMQYLATLVPRVKFISYVKNICDSAVDSANPNFILRVTAMKTLGKVDPNSYEYLLQSLSNKSQAPELRSGILEGLVATGTHKIEMAKLLTSFIDSADTLVTGYQPSDDVLRAAGAQASSYYVNLISDTRQNQMVRSLAYSGLVATSISNAHQMAIDLHELYAVEGDQYVKTCLIENLGAHALKNQDLKSEIKIQFAGDIEKFILDNYSSQDDRIKDELETYQEAEIHLQ